jgi:outer membrane protein assembly factor BamA
MTPLPLLLSSLLSLASWQDSPSGATESYRGRVIREVRLEHPGGPPPEASRQLIELVPGEIYHPEAVRRSIQQLFSLGVFSDIKVEAFPAGDEQNEVSVLFRLFPRLEVAEVDVEGLEASPDLSALRSRLLEESQVQRGDPLEVDRLAAAAERLSVLLRAEGYPWASVEPEASFQSPSAVVVFHVEPGARALLGALDIQGVPPHIEAHIRRELALVEGAPYSRRELDEKIQTLSTRWKEAGYYGATVSIEEVPAAAARVDVRITPEMGPRVRVEVRGWDFGEKELRKLVPLFTEARFTEDLVEESRANLEEALREQGHRDAAVSVEREILGDDHLLVLRFVAEPGPRFEVASIEIEGLRSASEAEIRALLVTRSRGRVGSAPFRKKIWEADLKEVRTYLESRGYHRAGVDSLERLDPEAEGVLALVLHVEEGPRAFVSRVELEGRRLWNRKPFSRPPASPPPIPLRPRKSSPRANGS